jgi:DNA polymerase-1
MDALAALYLGRSTMSFESVCGTGKNKKTFDQVDVATATRYAAEDADITLCLYEFLKARLEGADVASLYYDVERPLLPAIVAMERAGVTIDAGILQAFGQELSARLEALQAEIYLSAGREFNIGSPKQLGTVLFEELGMPAPKMSKTGAYSTDMDVLEGLVAKGFDLPKKVLEWRSCSKLLSTYVEGLQSQINAKTGRVHTSYVLSGTTTGRLASSEPNLQNIPIRTADGRRIRKAFVAKPGYVFVSLDYSQIELRLLAHFADVPTLRQAFLDGVDSHKMTASYLFGVPYDAVTAEQRRQAKTVNFGIIYGISTYGLATQLMIPNAAAAELIKAYMERYPGIAAFMADKKAEAAEHGYVTTLMGRRCYTPGINDRNGSIRQFAERQAVNAPLQGTNADIIKKAMVQIQKWLEVSKIDASMLLQVHDELIFEVVDQSEVRDALIAKVKEIMEGVVTLSVPLIVEAGVGYNWDDAHS